MLPPHTYRAAASLLSLPTCLTPHLRPRVCSVEGAEYTLVAHMALSGVLCSVDTLLLEWHQRYFHPSRSHQVARALNIPSWSGGQGTLAKWTSLTPAALDSALRTCDGSTRVLPLDDEKFLFDRKPWPAGPVCGALRRRADGSLTNGGGSVSITWRLRQELNDAMLTLTMARPEDVPWLAWACALAIGIASVLCACAVRILRYSYDVEEDDDSD